MPLTKEQGEAAHSIVSWLNSPSSKWDYILHGYAGTGKTYLLGELISGMNCAYWCCAPTGKAASVLAGKLKGVTVMTVHQLLYQPAGQSLSELEALIEKGRANPSPEMEKQIRDLKLKLSKQGPSFSLKENLMVERGDLVIVDESSMVTSKMRGDFEDTGAKVLFVGDPGQLPPVGSSSWFTQEAPDFTLRDIQRQALDNPIIRLSMDIRNGEVDPKQYQTEACRILPKGKVDSASWLDFDQVLTGMNKTRCKINRFFRKSLGRGSPLPMAGEKLICIKNNLHGTPRVVNGVMFHAIEDVEFDPDDIHTAEVISMNYEGRELLQEPFYTYHTHKHYDYTLTEEPRDFRKGLVELDYAYAITVHKSQGSEWDSVLLADDDFQKQDLEFRKKYLYTAVTRAKKKLLIVK